MNTYVFIIAKKDLYSSIDDAQYRFEHDLVTKFTSYDFMKGFAQGYGFGKIKVLTLQEFQHQFNQARIKTEDNLIYFVSVEPNDDVD